MLQQVDEFIDISDHEVRPYVNDLIENGNVSDTFEDTGIEDEMMHQWNSSHELVRGFESSGLADISIDLSLICDAFLGADDNFCLFDVPQSPHFLRDPMISMPDINDFLNHGQFLEVGYDQNRNYDLYGEIIAPVDSVNDTQEQTNFEINTDQSASYEGLMTVREQPKPDQRARYASDGLRFLPDSKKNPMSVQLPDLSSTVVEVNTVLGIILTMVTSTNNPKNKTFVHVNGLKYRTGDAIELSHGSIFLPLTKLDIQNCVKSFPRLSIICKKYDEYTFDLTTFDTSTCDTLTEKYVMTDQNDISNAAKGKQFTIDYDLLCYKIVFQLALQQGSTFQILNTKCETNIINEQKTPTKGVKSKASSSAEITKNRKDGILKPVLNPFKKYKSSASSVLECPVTRTSNRRLKRSKGSSVGSL